MSLSWIYKFKIRNGLSTKFLFLLGIILFMNIIYAEFPRDSSIGGHMLRINDPNIIENYLTDESRIVRGSAVELVLPRCEKEISEILREANDKRVHVTISGAGTGITGSRVPIDGIILSTEELTQVEIKPSKNEKLLQRTEYGKTYAIIIGKDHDGYYAIAPPGIPLIVFKRMVESENLYYPPDPTEMSAFLGGTIATNASGARTFYYGSTRNYVRRLRIVLPNGDVLNVKRGQIFANDRVFIIVLTNGKKIEVQVPGYTMPDVKKNSAGYYVKSGMDLIDLFIGSEGTLGVISEVEVKLIEKPKIIIPIFAHFRSESDAINFVKRLRNLSRSEGLRVLSIEFFDSYSVEFLRRKYPPPKIPEGSKSIIDFELEVLSDEESDMVLERVMRVLEECNFLNAFVLSEDEAKEIRHALPEGVNDFIRSHGTHKVATDIAVPEDKFDVMFEWYHRVGEQTGIRYVIFGHIGDNHLHFNFLPADVKELEKAMEAIVLLLRKAVELGGTVTAEHGVGKKYYISDGKRKPLLELMYGEEGVFQAARLKHAMDPNHILNIGNMVPTEYLDKINGCN